MMTRRNQNGRGHGRSDQRGAVLLMMVFLVTFSTLFVGALLRSHTSDLQIARNHIGSMKALFVADAGIEDAIAELRNNFSWSSGFSNKTFPAGSGSHYSVSVTNNHPKVVITSIGTADGFVRTIEIELNIVETTAPYPVRVIYWKEV